MNSKPADSFHWNLSLALQLALRSLAHHRLVAVATVLGVAMGVSVVAAILIVDHNTVRSGAPSAQSQINDKKEPASLKRSDFILTVEFERQRKSRQKLPVPIPTQEGEARSIAGDHILPEVRRGEADYQTMRIAVRLASLLSFFVGALIVFYTMRFSVVSRAREFCLVLCVGEFRRNVALSLISEALILGAIGAVAGLLLGLPIAAVLLAAGISTTGSVPAPGFEIPWLEMIALGSIAISVALLGVASPARQVLRLDVPKVLQPRFLNDGNGGEFQSTLGLSWLIPLVIAASWLALRPFIQGWFSLVTFFIVEILIVLLISAATLWWARPLLRALMVVGGWITRTILPLETLLVAKRMKLSVHRVVFPVIAVSLVFSLLTGLHAVTRSLQIEVEQWAQQALHPYSYFKAGTKHGDEAALQQMLDKGGIVLFRVSDLMPGDFPIRLIRASDANKWLEQSGRPTLGPGEVLLSTTLAAHFGLSVGDRVILSAVDQKYSFDIVNIADDIGFFARDGRYVDLKSYALFTDGNPIFENNLETTLGKFAKARPSDPEIDRLQYSQELSLRPHFRYIKDGYSMGIWQVDEIEHDFLIFDFVLFMTIALAAVGVTNTMLIQVNSRKRELSVLRSVGMNRWQVLRMLLLEGLLIGIASAVLALIIGSLLALISIGFLDRFTLFHYEFEFSWSDTLWISLLTLFACCASAVYPALGATRISSAESLHYE